MHSFSFWSSGDILSIDCYAINSSQEEILLLQFKNQFKELSTMADFEALGRFYVHEHWQVNLAIVVDTYLCQPE